MDESASQREVRTAYRVPGGVRLRVDAREVLAWRPEHEMSVREVAAHPDDLPVGGRLFGRGALRRIDSGPQKLLVREYRKGGLLRRFRGRLMRGRWRPLDELALHCHLQAIGVPVPVAVGAVVLRRALGWRGFLLMEEVEGAVDLEALLHGVEPPAGTDVRSVLRTAGLAVRALHDAGVAHPDLHPKNLLLAPDGVVLVIDLDRARPANDVLDERRRLENLVRLGRAIEKHRLKGLRVSRRDALRFLEGYAGSPEAAHLWLERIRSKLLPGLGLRILWWRLLGEARPWRPPAPGSA